MSELGSAIDDYLGSLALRDDSPHTLRNYEADLREFAAYFSPEGSEPPALAELDLLALREWLAHLYERDQKPTTIRRKMASLRGLFRYLSREHRISRDPARLLRLPKMPKSLPQVPNAEVTNALAALPRKGQSKKPPTLCWASCDAIYLICQATRPAIGLTKIDAIQSNRSRTV